MLSTKLRNLWLSVEVLNSLGNSLHNGGEALCVKSIEKRTAFGSRGFRITVTII